MNKRLPALLLILAAASGSAYAQQDLENTGFYSGAILSRWQYEQALGPEAEGRLQTLELNAGLWYHPLLSAEVRAGIGLGDQDVQVGDNAWETTVERTASVYWRPELANDRAKLYGLLGYSRVQLEAEDNAGAPVDLTDSGPSFGAGVGFYFEEKVTLNVEWRQLIDADGFEMSGLSAGFDYRF